MSSFQPSCVLIIQVYVQKCLQETGSRQGDRNLPTWSSWAVGDRQPGKNIKKGNSDRVRSTIQGVIGTGVPEKGKGKGAPNRGHSMCKGPEVGETVVAGTVIKRQHGKDKGGKWAGPGGQFGFTGRAMGSHGQIKNRAGHFRVPQKLAGSTYLRCDI